MFPAWSFVSFMVLAGVFFYGLCCFVWLFVCCCFFVFLDNPLILFEYHFSNAIFLVLFVHFCQSVDATSKLTWSKTIVIKNYVHFSCEHFFLWWCCLFFVATNLPLMKTLYGFTTDGFIVDLIFPKSISCCFIYF